MPTAATTARRRTSCSRPWRRKTCPRSTGRPWTELIQDHAWAREATASLVKAKDAYLLEKPGALNDLMEHLEKLVEFYPRHIDKEDKHFFIPCLAYFSEAEQADLLARMHEFDRQLIHEKYRGLVETMEQRRGCKTCH